MKESKLDFSHNQRDSNPEMSSHLKSHNLRNDPHATFHDNHSDIDIIATQQFQQHMDENLIGFTNTNIQINDLKTAPLYSDDSNVTNKTTAAKIVKDEKFDDLASTEGSNFCSSSIHESHSSRKSLTKK